MDVRWGRDWHFGTENFNGNASPSLEACGFQTSDGFEVLKDGKVLQNGTVSIPHKENP